MNTPLPANLVDVSACVFVLLGTVLGLRRGLTSELGRLIILLLATATAIFVYRPCSSFLSTHTPLSHEGVRLISALVAFSVPFGIFLTIRYLIGRVLKVTFVEWLDRLGGAIAGFLSSTLFVILIFIIMNVLPLRYRTPAFGKESWIGRVYLSYKSDVTEVIDDEVLRTQEAIQKARESHAGQRERWEE